jgi:hypothetical protein
VDGGGVKRGGAMTWLEWAISLLTFGLIIGFVLGYLFRGRHARSVIVHRGCAVVDKRSISQITAEVERGLKRNL